MPSFRSFAEAGERARWRTEPPCDRPRMTDTLKPRDAKEVEVAVQWALAEGKALEVMGQGSKRAIGRPAQTDLTLDLSGLSASRSTSPRNWCCRRGPVRRSPRSRRWWRPTASNSRSSRWTAARSSARRLARHHRWRAGDQSCRSPPPPGGRRARSLPWLHGGVRPRRNLQVRRPSGQERHRLRSLQAARRLLGDAGRDDRRHVKTLPRPESEETILVLGLEPPRAVAAMTAAIGSSCDVSGAAHLPAARLRWCRTLPAPAPR